MGFVLVPYYELNASTTLASSNIQFWIWHKSQALSREWIYLSDIRIMSSVLLYVQQDYSHIKKMSASIFADGVYALPPF